MGQLEDAFRDAAGEVAQIKAQPSNRYWWLYGTIMGKNSNGTLDVKIDGVTIQQVKATVSCMYGSVGDRVVVLKAGPLMTCVDLVAKTSNMEAQRAALGLRLAPVTVCAQTGTHDGVRYFVIGRSSKKTTDGTCYGHVRVVAEWGGLSGPDISSADVTFDLRVPTVSVSNCSTVNGSNLYFVRDKDGYLWVYLSLKSGDFSAHVSIEAVQFDTLSEWRGAPPTGEVIWRSDKISSSTANKQGVWSGMGLGDDLSAKGDSLKLQRPVIDSTNIGDSIFGAAGVVFSNVGGGHSGSGLAADLDNVTPGVWMYNNETAHIPNDYGLCLTIWSDLDRVGKGDWRVQLSFPTVGDLKWRRNINRNGWSSWWTIPSS